jgi:hypothetical protein
MRMHVRARVCVCVCVHCTCVLFVAANCTRIQDRQAAFKRYLECMKIPYTFTHVYFCTQHKQCTHI